MSSSACARKIQTSVDDCCKSTHRTLKLTYSFSLQDFGLRLYPSFSVSWGDISATNTFSHRWWSVRNNCSTWPNTKRQNFKQSPAQTFFRFHCWSHKTAAWESLTPWTSSGHKRRLNPSQPDCMYKHTSRRFTFCVTSTPTAVTKRAISADITHTVSSVRTKPCCHRGHHHTDRAECDTPRRRLIHL